MMASGLMTPIKTPGLVMLQSTPSTSLILPSSETSSAVNVIINNNNVINKDKCNLFGVIREESVSATGKPKKTPAIDLKTLGSGKCCNKDERYPTSYFRQLSILLLRTFLILWRDRSLTTMRIAIHMMMAPLIGMLYFGIGDDAHHALNNYKYAFFSVMFLMYTAFSSIVMNCKNELEAIDFLIFNNLYINYFSSAGVADHNEGIF